MARVKARKALIADDSVFARQLLKRILKELGLSADESRDGRETLRAVAENAYDCLFLDLNMPVLSGLEILPTLKEKHPALPVIVCSADIQDAVRDECFRLGAVGFIQKPFLPNGKDRLRAVLERAGIAMEKPSLPETSPTPSAAPEDPRVLAAAKTLIRRGISRAAISLNELLETEVTISVADAALVPLRDIEGALGREKRGPGPYSRVRLDFHGAIDGFSALELSRESAATLVSLLTGRLGQPFEDMDFLKVSTINEVGNIVLNGVMGEIVNALGGRLEYRLPRYRELSEWAFELPETLPIDTLALIVRAEFCSGERNISGDILLAMGHASFARLAEMDKTP